MKKIFAIFILCTLYSVLCTNSRAQGYGMCWNKIGNTMYNGQFLGSTNNRSVIFRVNNLYSGALDSTRIFKWGGTFAVPNLFITNAGQLTTLSSAKASYFETTAGIIVGLDETGMYYLNNNRGAYSFSLQAGGANALILSSGDGATRLGGFINFNTNGVNRAQILDGGIVSVGYVSAGFDQGYLLDGGVGKISRRTSPGNGMGYYVANSYAEGHMFGGLSGDNYTHTSGTKYGVQSFMGIAAAAGSGNMVNTNIKYTINNSGAQTGAFVGLQIDATQTALNGMTHTLFDFKVGGASKISGTNNGDVTANSFITQTIFRLKSYTVATLPAGAQGDCAFVTDALAPAYLTAVVGGGAIVTPVFYDGTNWVAH